MRVCSTSQGGCGALHDGPTWRCPTCAHTHTRDADRARRPEGNPYNTPGHHAFREGVLTRDPICVLCYTRHATIADHYPHERRDLVAMGLDPDDPKRGRGLCKPCHDRHTAATSPGGWNQRNN